jgi:hypothetical protein
MRLNSSIALSGIVGVSATATPVILKNPTNGTVEERR